MINAQKVAMMKRVLFFRDYRAFYGGHLKVWDYFNHVRHLSDHTPYIYFSMETKWDASNPWFNIRNDILSSPQKIKPDILFLAGLDWLMVPDGQKQLHHVPIINLIQHVRHGQTSDPRYPFLRYRAIRICCSEEVRSVINSTKIVNGPVFAIPYGIDRNTMPECLPIEARDTDILIAGLKRPEIALQLHRDLKPLADRIVVLTERILRSDFLDRISRAKITIFLPDETEGFYLPALEGMALGTLVICPDCVGNRSFCLDGYNCFRPNYKVTEILEAAKVAVKASFMKWNDMLLNAKSTAYKHDISKERKEFLEILENVNQIW